MKCPYCRSLEVYQSKSGNSLLTPLQRLFVVCLRCHRCGQTFRRSTALGGNLVAESPKQQSTSRRKPEYANTGNGNSQDYRKAA